MTSSLIVRAGSRARARLEKAGFQRDDFTTLVGASGGPKWLVLGGIDRVLCEQLVSDRQEPLHVLGSSIGAWRHACFAQADPLAALERFEESYTAQVYEEKPTQAEVAVEMERVLRDLLGPNGAAEIVANEKIRTHIATVRSRAVVASDARWPLALGLGAAAITNAISRPALGAFFDRVIFRTGNLDFGFEGFSTAQVDLQQAAVTPAILATGSVPLLISGVRDVPGGPRGLYRDGGIVDYHFDFRFGRPGGLTLYPHFFERITPGWFDKALRWRKPRPEDLEDVVQIAPSAAFIESLPGGRVPDRTDFETMPTAERLRAWEEVLRRAREPADELRHRLATGSLLG